MGRVRRPGTDAAVGRGNDCEVRRNSAVKRVQRRDDGLALALRPQGQVPKGARRYDRGAEDVRLGVERYAAGASGDIYIPFSAERQRSGRLARVQDTAGRDAVEGQSPCSHRSEVAVDVDDEIGGITREDVDGAAGSGRHDGGIGGD